MGSWHVYISEVLQRRHQHFNKLLNLQSSFIEEAIQQMAVLLPPYMDLDGPPTEKELETALLRMKRRKAGGKLASRLNWRSLVVHSSGTG